ncbi:MAG: DUF2029 domain-containing protein [Proteobacteria bacterium]|nr:DUF2029 domain-containing protein [Pseudomonadota bacterium]NBY20099.1 DUF2029 domain-containing protein [bacterium]
MQNKIKWFLLIALLIPCWVIGIKYDIDLVVLHATAQFMNGDYTRVYAQNGNLGRYFYGPFSLILIKPLGYLPYVAVKYFWLCLQTVCYFVFWKVLSDLYPFLKEKSHFWGWILIWIVAINPIHNNYQSNNIQLMLATILVLAEKMARSSSDKKQLLAGVLVTIAAGIKIFPLFLVAYYFLARNNQIKKGIILGSLMILVSPFLFLGLDKAVFLYGGFFQNLTTYSAENSLTATNDILCIPSLLARFGLPNGASNVFVLLISALFFIWVLMTKKKVRDSRSELHTLAVAWALSVLLNPSTRPHYFIFYVPAFCSIYEILLHRTRSIYLNTTLAIATLLIAFTTEGVVGKKVNEILEANSVPTYGMVILCTLLFVLISKDENTVSTSEVRG